MLRPLSLAGVVILSSIAFASPATAAVGSIPGYSFTGGFESVSPVANTVGYWFYVRPEATNVTVTQLGFIDTNSDGLTQAHPIGFWSDGGTLLTSTSVPAGTVAPLVGGFRYVPITPIALAPDTRYWVGAQVFNDETYVNQVSQASAAPFIIVNQGLTFFRNGAGLNFPGNAGNSGGSSAVANFQYIVPEPASLSLIGLGGLALLRRRRN